MVRALLVLIVLLAAAATVAEGRDDRCSSASGGPCPSYDRDGDGVRNEPPYPEGTQPDNCPDVKNGGQENVDGDARGDACDVDIDEDGVHDKVDADGNGIPEGPSNPRDNCPWIANPGQEDADGDGYGDPCPPKDTDGDGHNDDRDNCLTTPNPDQADSEPSQPDGKGDVCDGDDDDDRVPDHMDNCDFVDNPEQTDRDGDGAGTACDPDEVQATSEPTPGPGGGGGGGGDGGAGTDRSAPAVRVGAAATWTAADLRGRAPLSVRCSEACGLTARLTLRGRLLAAGTATLGGSGRTYVFFAPRRGAVARVARLRTRRRAVLTVRAVDEAGNRRTAKRRVWLRR